MLFTRPPMDAFLRNEDGTTTIYSTMMLLAILGITGASVDFMNHEAMRIELQSALDRAVLAAADLDQKQAPADVVADYVAKAGLADRLAGVTANAGLNDRVVEANAAFDFNTLFLQMSGLDTLPMHTSATAEERIANVEISLVLDISGSMRFNGRLDNLKPAAKGFVAKVLADQSAGVTTLNLVPFAGQVNPGSIMFDYFRGTRPSVPVGLPAEAPGEDEDTDHFAPWAQAISNIVMYFDTDGDDIFDRAHKIQSLPENAPRDVDDFYKGAVAYAVQHDPALTDTRQFLGISIKGGKQTTRYFTVRGNTNGPDSDLGPTNNNGRIPGDTFSYGQIDYASMAQAYSDPVPETGSLTINLHSSCIEVYDDEFATTDLPQSDDWVPHFHHWPTAPDVMDWGWCPEDDTAVQYYSDDAAFLSEFIDSIRMHDGTGLQYGMKYALALLDPATRGAVAHMISEGLVDERFVGRPIDWEDAETEKFIVVMTDGQVTDQWRPDDPMAAVNGEVELKTQGSDSYHNASTRSVNLANLYAQCELAHQNGVTVFAIAFETTDAAADEMRLCASSDSHFFHVHGEEIVDAFDTVARQINNLRLIQ